MEPESEDVSWRDLEAQSDRPEVQDLIRREIRKGTIRVRPASDGGIRIIPVLRPTTHRPSGDAVPRNILAAFD